MSFHRHPGRPGLRSDRTRNRWQRTSSSPGSSGPKRPTRTASGATSSAWSASPRLSIVSTSIAGQQRSTAGRVAGDPGRGLGRALGVRTIQERQCHRREQGFVTAVLLACRGSGIDQTATGRPTLRRTPPYEARGSGSTRRQSHHWDRSPCCSACAASCGWTSRWCCRPDRARPPPRSWRTLRTADRPPRPTASGWPRDCEPRWVSGGAAGRTGDDVVGAVLREEEERASSLPRLRPCRGEASSLAPAIGPDEMTPPCSRMSLMTCSSNASLSKLIWTLLSMPTQRWHRAQNTAARLPGSGGRPTLQLLLERRDHRQRLRVVLRVRSVMVGRDAA